MPPYRFLLFALLISAGACAGSGRSAAPGGELELPERFSVRFRTDLPGHSTRIAAPLERVAAAVPPAYRQMGLAVAPASNPEELIFITPNLRLSGKLYEGERNSEYIDCGTSHYGAVADTHELQFAIYTRLSADDAGGTLVETLLSGFARRPNVSAGGVIPCAGTGKLEGIIAGLLRTGARD